MNPNLLIVGGTTLLLYLILRKKNNSMDLQISKNFTLSEFEYSNTAIKQGIENKVTDQGIYDAIQALTLKVLQPLRDNLNKSVQLYSGYRNPVLNKAVGGVTNSQHMKGEAADIHVSGMTPYQLAKKIVDLKLPYDQLILYPTFVHVSYTRTGKQRYMLLYNSKYTGQRL
jgi:uncharacterized protein YcbK (DUF882 family)